MPFQRHDRNPISRTSGTTGKKMRDVLDNKLLSPQQKSNEFKRLEEEGRLNGDTVLRPLKLNSHPSDCD